MMPTRTLRKTLLVVGEGYTERAFLLCLRQIYCSPGHGRGVEAPDVKVENARGSESTRALEKAVDLHGKGQYDSCLCFCDSFPPPARGALEKVRGSGIPVVESRPCFESFFLSLSGRRGEARKGNPKEAARVAQREFRRRFGLSGNGKITQKETFVMVMSTLHSSPCSSPSIFKKICGEGYFASLQAEERKKHTSGARQFLDRRRDSCETLDRLLYHFEGKHLAGG